jgi:16S rRNA processing protein RimM
VTTKEQADALKGVELYAERDRLPALPDDEFYHADLIGLAVRDTGGATIGQVLAVYNHGAGDILELRLDGHKSALLLPFTLINVPVVDVTKGWLVVDVPEGLE